MNTFAAIFCLAIATASASHVGYGLVGHDVHSLGYAGHYNSAAHIASGSVGVSADGVVLAGPSGSVRTNNGLHGHGAGAVVSGPAGDVSTHGGIARLAGPGAEHHEVAHVAHHGLAYAAPIAHHAYAAPIAHHAYAAGPVSHASIVGPSAHATVVAGSAHHGLAYAAPLAHHSVYAAAPAWAHSGVVAHHGLVGYGHHGW